jgi:hypothetical protein
MNHGRRAPTGCCQPLANRSWNVPLELLQISAFQRTVATYPRCRAPSQCAAPVCRTADRSWGAIAMPERRDEAATIRTYDPAWSLLVAEPWQNKGFGWSPTSSRPGRGETVSSPAAAGRPSFSGIDFPLAGSCACRRETTAVVASGRASSPSTRAALQRRQRVPAVRTRGACSRSTA